jgi:hypothetical protein
MLRALARLDWFRPHRLEFWTDDGWTALAASGVLSEVRDLHVVLADDDAARELASIRATYQLRELGLGSHNLTTAEPLRQFLRAAHLPALIRLWLAFDTPAGGDLIATTLSNAGQFSCLRNLNLSGNNFTEEACSVLASSPILAGIQTLNLSECNITQEGARRLFNSPHLGRLERLDYTENTAGDAVLAALANSPWLSNIRELALSGRELSEARFRGLVESPHLDRLELLHLSFPSLSAHMVSALADRQPSRLRCLYLNTQADISAGWSALTRATLTGLRDLRVFGPPLGDAAIPALTSAPWFGQLYRLGLEKIGMSDLGLAELLAQVQAGPLAELWLGFNQLTAASGQAILGWPRLPSLTFLTLRGNAVPPALYRDITAVVERGPG